jgi:murein tripeptide amidase MpaA
MKDRKGVIISARVHPGETIASFMMKGVIEFLISNTPEAIALREKFIFKIIPMINPDGVINGNYRSSLAGCDLNRRYKNPSKELHPVVYSIKQFTRNFARERELVLFCDLHGHSRRKNIFMYGNTSLEHPEKFRIFPFIMSKLLDYFSYDYCRF